MPQREGPEARSAMSNRYAKEDGEQFAVVKLEKEEDLDVRNHLEQRTTQERGPRG